MQTLLTELAVSMSEFKKNPAAVLRQAQGQPVAVLNHNKVDFYLLTPRLLEQLLASARGAETEAMRTAPVSASGPRAHFLRQAKAAAE